MRGRTGFNAVASNVFAMAPEAERRKYASRHPQLCWACQKEKPTLGGRLNITPGFHKFVCKDCCDASAAKKAAL